MSKATQKRRALARWRYRARSRHLTLARGEWSGFPADAVEVCGHHPDYPDLRGWIFTAWQYHPRKANPPWWWVPHYTLTHEIQPGEWVLRRVADADAYAVLTAAQFEDWQSWRKP